MTLPLSLSLSLCLPPSPKGKNIPHVGRFLPQFLALTPPLARLKHMAMQTSVLELNFFFLEEERTVDMVTNVLFSLHGEF